MIYKTIIFFMDLNGLKFVNGSNFEQEANLIVFLESFEVRSIKRNINTTHTPSLRIWNYHYIQL